MKQIDVALGLLYRRLCHREPALGHFPARAGVSFRRFGRAEPGLDLLESGEAELSSGFVLSAFLLSGGTAVG